MDQAGPLAREANSKGSLSRDNFFSRQKKLLPLRGMRDALFLNLHALQG